MWIVVVFAWFLRRLVHIKNWSRQNFINLTHLFKLLDFHILNFDLGYILSRLYVLHFFHIHVLIGNLICVFKLMIWVGWNRFLKLNILHLKRSPFFPKNIIILIQPFFSAEICTWFSTSLINGITHKFTFQVLVLLEGDIFVNWAGLLQIFKIKFLLRKLIGFS